MNLACYLPLFPGLALETLVVEDSLHSPAVHSAKDAANPITRPTWLRQLDDRRTYSEVHDLVRSQGFKKLTYISLGDDFLTWQGVLGQSTRLQGARPAQPHHWDEMIKKKDGERSAANVKLCIKRDGWDEGIEQAARKRYAMASPVPPPRHRHRPTSTSALGIFEVHVHRGRDADNVQDGKMLDRNHDGLRTYFNRMSWRHVKSHEFHVPYPKDCTGWV